MNAVKKHKKIVNQKHNFKKRAEAQVQPKIELNLIQIIFAATLFTSASLLFTVEPMAAKMLLPMLGGSPSVWTTCMVFFQTLLLGGYLYAHLLSTKLSLKKQAIVHLSMIAASMIFMPVHMEKYWTMVMNFHPVVGVMGMLTLSLGLPFLTLSASAPLLQHWFSNSKDASSKNPYFLYGASNLGSLIALASYSTLIEPNFGLSLQSKVWTGAYVVLAALVIASLYRMRTSIKANQSEIGSEEDVLATRVDADDEEAPSMTQKLRWVALAFVPSSLMLGVTTYFTTDIATIPLLWTIPLGLYLLTFIVVFSKYTHTMHRAMSYLLPITLVALLYQIVSHTYVGIGTSLFMHLATFFVITMVLHGELALSRPSVKYLTQFYLLMSLGGMLGGVFNAVIAPFIFKGAIEYTIALVASAFLIKFTTRKPELNLSAFSWPLHVGAPVMMAAATAWFVLKWPLASLPLEWFSADKNSALITVTYGLPAIVCLGLVFMKRAAVFGLTMAAFTAVGLYFNIYEQYPVFKDRSFFGVLKVSDNATGEYRTLINGTTVHGRQFLDERSQEPLTYYHRRGPVGDIFEEFSGPNAKRNLAFIGLGTGTLTSYSNAGQNVDVYEIDDSVVNIANNYFTYLKNAKGTINIVMGDARLKLKEASDQKYGTILVDAFSSDAIPVHLLTREAIELYFSKVEKDGIVAIHTSNRYLSLEPVVGRIAKDLRLVARVNHDTADSDNSKFASTWILLARDEAHMGSISQSSRWQKLDAYAWTPVWSDDFTSLFGVLR